MCMLPALYKKGGLNPPALLSPVAVSAVQRLPNVVHRQGGYQ